MLDPNGRHMIHIEKHDKYGWAITEPTEELLDYIIMQGWTELDMGRQLDIASLIGTSGAKGTDKATGGKSKPKGSNSRKYICPCCGAIVRATRDLEIVCKPCGQDFIQEG